MTELVVAVRIERGDGTVVRFGGVAQQPENPRDEGPTMVEALRTVQRTLQSLEREVAARGVPALPWELIDQSEAAFTPAPESAGYLTKAEQAKLEEDVPEHEFTPGPSGIACVHMVLRGDSGEDCGLPADSIVHEAGS